MKIEINISDKFFEENFTIDRLSMTDMSFIEGSARCVAGQVLKENGDIIIDSDSPQVDKRHLVTAITSACVLQLEINKNLNDNGKA